MKLYNLLNGVDIISKISSELLNSDVNDIKINVSSVTKGDVFVCIKGSHFDTHTLVLNALDRGARVIITSYNLNIPNQIIVLNTRYCYSIMCQNYFNNPAKKLNLIGVTGTNGKTSTTYIIYNILKSIDYKIGLIGTTKNIIDDMEIDATLTTPDAYSLNSLFKQMLDNKISHVVLEASSHALDQGRLGNTEFAVGIFTNLTSEHLDYHNNMEQYFIAKKKLFYMSLKKVINIDDEYGLRLYNEFIGESLLSYSCLNKDADFFADNIIYSKDFVSFTLAFNNTTYNIKFAIPGLYSVYNALAALAALYSINIPIDLSIKYLGEIKGIIGRNETLYSCDEFSVIRDYAHTPDGIKNILKGVKSYAKGRVVILFGCGGNRDKSKRKLMAMIALKYADFAIITSDNPRFENPKEIIDDILEGTNGYTNFITIENRRKAIYYAIENRQVNDIIILAGKGHEDYQIIDDVKYPFDEKTIVLEKLISDGVIE